MTNDEYHASAGYSKSHLDKIADCPRDYWHHYLNPDRGPEEQSPDLILGSAIHSAVLEPDLFKSQFLVLPDLDLRTKKGREERDLFVANNPGAAIITVEQRETALAVRDAVHTHPVASRLLRRGAAEQSWFAVDPETGEQIKCRTDWFDDGAGLIVDLKSTKDASPDGFGKSAANLRYHLQPPWYQDVFEAEFGAAPPWWVFLAVEKVPPYKIGIYYPTPEDIQLGRQMARRDFMRIIDCKRTGQWPDYATEAKPLMLPGWYKRSAA